MSCNSAYVSAPGGSDDDADLKRLDSRVRSSANWEPSRCGLLPSFTLLLPLSWCSTPLRRPNTDLLLLPLLGWRSGICKWQTFCQLAAGMHVKQHGPRQTVVGCKLRAPGKDANCPHRCCRSCCTDATRAQRSIDRLVQLRILLQHRGKRRPQLPLVLAPCAWAL